MTLRLVIGRSGTGKTKRCFDEIEKRLITQPDGPPLIYIVPDQMTFHTEYAFATLPAITGMTRLDVYSFSRLALRTLERTGGVTRQHLTTVGLSMVLRKIVENRKSELQIFQKAADQRGFYALLQQTVSEFKRYCLSAEDLKQKYQDLLNDENNDETLLKDKLHDLQLIYNDFEAALLGKYIDSDDYLSLAASKIPKWDDLKESNIWIDGFESFTPQEIDVITALAKTGKHVTITLTLDRIYEGKTPKDLTLFRRTAATCVKLINLAQEEGIELEEPVICDTNKKSQAEGLRHLEEHFEKRPFVSQPADDSIRMIEAVNRREEIEATAREILHLVRDKGYRYRDLSILTRDLSSYRELIETIFYDYSIPLFIDQKRTMHHHPVIELIRSSMDTILQNWRYEAVFRAFKTDLMYQLGDDLGKRREQIDQLENYVLAFGIHGGHWRSKKDWVYREYRGLDENDLPQKDHERGFEKKLNSWRWNFSDPLLTFERNMKKARNVREQATELFHYLADLSVPEKIEQLRNRAEAEGRLDEAREHDQVWKAVIDCLDQLVEAVGNEKMSLEQFAQVLDTGLDALRFALVPPALDQVLVGSIDRTRTADIRVTFVMGVNEGIFPAKPSEDGILSDEDREGLAERDVELAQSAREQLLDEEYLIYRAFTSPSERLYITYPLASEDGSTLMPSPIISRLEKYFTDIQPVFVSGEPHEVTVPEQLSFIVPSTRTISHAAGLFRRWNKGYPISELWWGTYNWFIESPVWRDTTKRILSSRFYKNKETRLPADTAEELYGHHIQASVSRMEMFNGCAFAQFSSYGLRLKEREIYRLEAPDIGQLFHAALKMMTDELMAQNKQWADLSKEECAILATKVVEHLAPRLQRQILLSSSRFQYLKRKLRETVSRAAWTLTRHAKASGFSPIGLELPFGPGKDLPPLQFALPNGGQMEIIGRIDRVDRGETSQGLLLRVIDYKSGAKDLSLSEVYYGIAMQMLAYLDVVLTNAKTWLGEEAEPAGALYFHVHNPMLNETDKPSLDDIEEKLYKQFKMKGLLLEDEETVRLMDQNLEDGDSAVVPVGFKKDGTLKKFSSVAKREEFNMLRHHVHDVMKKVGTDITDGVIEISPYKMGGRTPCQYCSFKSLCHFDPAQVDNRYRILKKEDNASIYEKINENITKEKGGKHDE